MDYKYYLWDVDGTILDFEAAEKAAIKKLFDRFGLGVCTDDMVKSYSLINKKYWQALERGEMTKPEILVGRFKEFFETQGIDTGLVHEFNEAYQLALGDTIVFCENAMEIIEMQKANAKVVLVTNGTATAQKKKLDRSGLDKIADYVFISEEVGYEKPSPAFFEKVFSEVGIEDKKEALIIGDSITSDIQGGINAGIDTCWYNPKNEKNSKDLIPTYEIRSLSELFLDGKETFFT